MAKDAGAGEAAHLERELAIHYAPRDAREGLAALLALDETLGSVLRTTSEPMLAQMRLTWWHDALAKLDSEPAPAMPVLARLQRSVVARGVGGSELNAMIPAWEILLDHEVLDAAALRGFATARGATLFAIAAGLVGIEADAMVADAGRGWALADLARHLSDAQARAEAAAMAAPLLAQAGRRRWSRRGRTLGAWAHLARMDLAEGPEGAPRAGSPGRVARLLWHAITGR